MSSCRMNQWGVSPCISWSVLSPNILLLIFLKMKRWRKTIYNLQNVISHFNTFISCWWPVHILVVKHRYNLILWFKSLLSFRPGDIFHLIAWGTFNIANTVGWLSYKNISDGDEWQYCSGGDLSQKASKRNKRLIFNYFSGMSSLICDKSCTTQALRWRRIWNERLTSENLRISKNSKLAFYDGNTNMGLNLLLIKTGTKKYLTFAWRHLLSLRFYKFPIDLNLFLILMIWCWQNGKIRSVFVSPV